MRMAIDETRDEPVSFEIRLNGPGCRKFALLIGDSKNSAPAYQDMADTEIFWCEDPGIGKELQQGMQPAKKWADILHYETSSKQVIRA